MRLYKYLHPDRIDVLRNGTIRFSSPKILNDPFELKPHISAITSKEDIHSDFEAKFPNILAEEYAKLPEQFRRHIPLDLFQKLARSQLPQLKAQFQEFSEMATPMLQRVISEKLEENIGILCLTESPDNLLMWSHYADSHQGFVIEFDTTVPFFDQRKSPEDELRHLRKVIYQERRPSLILSEVENFSSLLTKSVDWSYETEWRMMLPLFSASRIIGDGATAIHLYEFPRSAIRAIIFGCRMPKAEVDKIRQILHRANDFNDVLCLQVQIDETHYRLNFAEVRD
ncbi:MAG: DUF2971 domain-containing protein [Gallionella sp.]|nr:DUF2971 domain-containing protein [Gallionella sp.]